MSSLQSLTRCVVSLATLSLMGCVNTPQTRQPESVAVLQWQGVKSHAPLVATAYMQSLIALTEDGPEAIAAREQAFALARQCGLVTAQRQRPTCEHCSPPISEADSSRYLSCLSRRLNCLAPP